MKPLASVVIVARDEEKYLGKAVASILRQSYSPLELIIVDDGSQKPIRELLKSMPDPRMRIVQNPQNLGIARSRNIGWKEAAGEFVFFTDADCMPHKNWLENGVARLQETQAPAVEGATFYASAVTGAAYKITENPDGGRYFTCNMGFRRETLESLKGFDERFLNYYEDTQLARRVLEKGTIPFCLDMLVIHQKKKREGRRLIREWIARYEGSYEAAKLEGKKAALICGLDLVFLFYPFLMLIYYRIKSLDDVLILPWIYTAILTARVRIWKKSWKEKVFFI